MSNVGGYHDKCGGLSSVREASYVTTIGDPGIRGEHIILGDIKEDTKRLFLLKGGTKYFHKKDFLVFIFRLY